MTDFFIRIYDFLHVHKRLCMWIMTGVTALFLLLTYLIKYNENINDFLPLSNDEQKAITLYQDISGGKQIIALFHSKDTASQNRERLAQAVDLFAQKIKQGSGSRHISNITTQVDYHKFAGITDFVYSNIPLFLCDSDYVRMERLLADDTYIDSQLATDVQMVMMPATGFFSANISNDPLGLFTPVLERLQSRQSSMAYDIDNGYIYTMNGRYAVVMMTTPYGAMESANNALLTNYVDSVARQTMKAMPDVKVDVTGAPVIAVGNAKQIKADSVLAISISVTLILALLLFSFRSWKSLLLIGVSITFGWIFALGCLSMVKSEVSLIVLGIGSIIIGIAVNYPLHFIAHTAHGGTIRSTLKDMVAPLLIGNITTVGAFAALIPLDAPALHDLGMFAAFMLIGTILFALIFLPHLVKVRSGEGKERLTFGRLAAQSPGNSRWLVWAIVVITVILGYFSLSTSFDSDMHHINYMSPEQSRLLSRLQASTGLNDTANVYVVAEGKNWDEALAARSDMRKTIDSLHNGKYVDGYTDVTSFVCSKAEQQRRLDLWNAFWKKHRDTVMSGLAQRQSAFGFRAEAFDGFTAIVNKKYTVLSFQDYEPLTTTLLANSFSTVNGNHSIVDRLNTTHGNIQHVESSLKESAGNDGYAFDFTGMNSSIANSLSNNFNYIGYACGIIVFLFLWISMGRFELSVLSFLPMALGWVWILGIMEIFDMQFNIVNIILATFIFGQGDDYTIFITEGLIDEYAYRKKVLPSYKNSIVISALIMFIGMGSLIVARHPALYSLAEVTIVGMFTVVLMAWMVPPMVFNWILKTNGRYRIAPVTTEQIWRTAYCTLVYMFQLFYGSFIGFVCYLVPGKRRYSEKLFHKIICKSLRIDVDNLGGIKFIVNNEHGESFSRGSIALCNHQSILDPIYLLALSPNMLIVIGNKVWRNPIVHFMFCLSRFINVNQPREKLKSDIKRAVEDGYNVVFFPEGMRSSDGKIQRFHKGAFELAMELGTDILPLYLHGAGMVMPKGNGFGSRGQITITVGKRMDSSELASIAGTAREMAQYFKRLYQRNYAEIMRRAENTHYFHHFILYRYIYKGISVERQTRRMLSRYNDFSQWIDHKENEKEAGRIAVINSGKGQFALLYALVHPGTEVWSYTCDKDDYLLASNCTFLPSNLHIACVDQIADSVSDIARMETSPDKVFVLFPDENMTAETAGLSPVIVK